MSQPLIDDDSVTARPAMAIASVARPARTTARPPKRWVSCGVVPLMTNVPIASAAGDRDYSADTFGLRTQIDF